MFQLTLLNLDVAEVEVSALVYLEKLTSLKKLIFNKGKTELGQLTLPHTETLGLWDIPLLENFWTRRNHKFTNLKDVRFGPTPDVFIFDDILTNFPKFEAIKVEMTDLFKKLSYFCDKLADETYKRLKKLHITVNPPSKTVNVMPFVNLCTELEELSLCFRLHGDTLSNVLSNFSKLKTLSVFISDDLNSDKNFKLITEAIEEHGRNLQSIKFPFISCDWKVASAKKLLFHLYSGIECQRKEIVFRKRGAIAIEHISRFRD